MGQTQMVDAAKVGAVTEEHGAAAADDVLLQECLARAASFVRLASARLREQASEVGPGESGFDDVTALLEVTATAARLGEVTSLLESGCGAAPDADLLEDGLAGVGPGAVDPLELLYAADREFDRVPLGRIPLRLPSARAELAGAVLRLLPHEPLDDEVE